MLLKTDPKSLGVVQIMIAVVIMSFGIQLTNLKPLCVLSGVVYWGSLCFLFSGIMSAAAMDNRNLCMKSSLVTNALSILASLLSIIMLSVDLVHVSVELTPCYDLTNKDCLFIIMFEMVRGTFRILLFFSLLEIITAIWTFVLLWKTRDVTETMP